MNKKLFINLFKGHNKNITRKLVSGFTLIEVIVASSVISMCMFALMQSAQKGINLSGVALEKSQASLLLEEGAEAIKSIRDDNWTTISNLNNQPYYLFFNTNTKKWELNNIASTIDGLFTRTVIFSDVERDSNYDIVESGGTVYSGTKKVLVDVSWVSGDSSISRNLSFYISDIFN